jgi:glyoxylase-like metal-dependent hydrolase (beta-lactamase superfamily II)
MTTTTRRRASDPLRYPHAAPPQAGTVIEVAEGVYWLRMPLPYVLDHINLWLLDDDDGWVIVDAGYASGATRERWDALERDVMGGRRVNRLIVTHFHPDHIGLAAWLVERFGCELWMTAAEYQMAVRASEEEVSGSEAQRLAFLRQHGLDDQVIGLLGEWRGSYRRSVPQLPRSHLPLREGQALSIGGHEWRVIRGQGHSPDHATLYCHTRGVLISGDQILPTITPHVGVWYFAPAANPIGDYLASLQQFTTLPADTLVLPAHGLPFVGLPERLDMLAKHHAQRFDMLRKACGEPRSAEQVLELLFGGRLNSQQLNFAVGEAVAHLNYLEIAGVLVSGIGSDGVRRFVRR